LKKGCWEFGRVGREEREGGREVEWRRLGRAFFDSYNKRNNPKTILILVVTV
jgi:hypothetical protein